MLAGSTTTATTSNTVTSSTIAPQQPQSTATPIGMTMATHPPLVPNNITHASTLHSSLPSSIAPSSSSTLPSYMSPEQQQSIIASLSYTRRPLAPPATALATLAVLANPSNVPPSSLPIIRDDSSSSNNTVISNDDDNTVDAASPRRSKRERRDDYRSEILAATSNSSTQLPLWPPSNEPSPLSSHLHGRSIATTKLSQAQAPSLPVVIPLTMVITWDESRVVRTSLSRSVPWLREFIEANYDADELGQGWIQMLMSEQPKIRVCPSCSSPSSQCFNCRSLSITVLTTTTNTAPKPSFADWFHSSFFASMWLKKHVTMVDSRSLEAIPIAGFCWTFGYNSHQSRGAFRYEHKYRLTI
jgi:hypothetical protein